MAEELKKSKEALQKAEADLAESKGQEAKLNEALQGAQKEREAQASHGAKELERTRAELAKSQEAVQKAREELEQVKVESEKKLAEARQAAQQEGETAASQLT